MSTLVFSEVGKINTQKRYLQNTLKQYLADSALLNRYGYNQIVKEKAVKTKCIYNETLI